MVRLLFYATLFSFSFQLLSNADELRPINNIMPVILEPIMLQLRKNIGKEEGKIKRRQFFEVKPITIIFEITVRQPRNEEKAICEKIINVSYNISQNKFIIYLKKGLVVKMEHIDEFSNVHVCNLVIPNKLYMIKFKNQEYQNLSRDMLSLFYRKEFLFMDWQTGKYEAIAKASFTSDKIENTSDNAMLELTFASLDIECKFSFVKGQLFNACYISHASSKAGRDATYYTFGYNGDGSLILGNYLDSKKKTGLDMLFYDDMGLRMLAKFQGNHYTSITLWQENGLDSICFTNEEWKKQGKPRDWKELNNIKK
ncbi:MAG: hypothetical protein K6G44_03310 [Lentisphaeria bacterium]|nr:hypothetical protein [Lentisphaeria bacterium]